MSKATTLWTVDPIDGNKRLYAFNGTWGLIFTVWQCTPVFFRIEVARSTAPLWYHVREEAHQACVDFLKRNPGLIKP